MMENYKNYAEIGGQLFSGYGVPALWLAGRQGTAGACRAVSGHEGNAADAPRGDFLCPDAFKEFWRRLVEQEAGKFYFTGEELGLLERVGENFGYLDVQMQLKNLELYMEQAQVLIENAQKELKDRQKVARALSLMCGLFLVILLI